MLGSMIQLAIGLAELAVIIWALTSIAELKRGQATILHKLRALEAMQNDHSEPRAS